ncbi:HNH endonuclease signature motif containing protein [Ligilactobacillus salivarius]|nr:HNH endonuclease signature motif containing protein [Ligilactobacillus salivarius]
MKGLKFPGSEKGWFKKGQKSTTEKPLGSEYTSDGYVMVKVKMNGPRDKRWKLKHVLIWEKYNGPVPKDNVVTFLDGNKRNFDINNLACIRKGVNSVLNKKKLRSENKEIFEARVAQIELNQKIKRITKNLGSD